MTKHNEKNDVINGAEPFFFEGNKIGVLVIHGFTGTTQSMRFLGEMIAKAGYTVMGPRLTGHGISPEAMETASYKDWLKDVEEAYNELDSICESVFVVGLSMGGSLTLFLGENYPEIRGIMPINAAIELPDMESFYQAEKDSDQRFVAGIGSDIKQAGITEVAYSETPVKSMGDLMRIMAIVREDLNKIKMPALIFSSEVDHVVPPKNSDEIFEGIHSDDKTIIKLSESYHVATLDNDKELIAEKCIAFIKRVSQ